MQEKKFYFDHNATTPLHPEVKKVIEESLENFGNPSSLHSLGRKSKELIESSRAEVAEFIGASPEEIIFVGSGSEANNTVLNFFPCGCPFCASANLRKMEFITSRIEHPCILETAKCISKKEVNVIYIGVDKCGKVDLEELSKVISVNTSLVSVMMANNEIGTIQDIKKISEIVCSRKAFFHTDAVQAVGKIPVDVKDLNIDFLSFSAHKMYGPKGIGALYIRKGVPFCPLIHGGHQEHGRRAGTENTIGIIAFAKAVQMRKAEMDEEYKRLLKLKNILTNGIKDSIPDVIFNGHPEDSLVGTLNVSFYGAEGESVLLYLDMEGICVSTGSACASGSLDPSHVLLATGLDAEHAHGSIRISMGRSTTQSDIIYLLENLKKVIAKVRSISTTRKK